MGRVGGPPLNRRMLREMESGWGCFLFSPPLQRRRSLQGLGLPWTGGFLSSPPRGAFANLSLVADSCPCRLGEFRFFFGCTPGELWPLQCDTCRVVRDTLRGQWLLRLPLTRRRRIGGAGAFSCFSSNQKKLGGRPQPHFLFWRCPLRTLG